MRKCPATGTLVYTMAQQILIAVIFKPLKLEMGHFSFLWAISSISLSVVSNRGYSFATVS